MSIVRLNDLPADQKRDLALAALRTLFKADDDLPMDMRETHTLLSQAVASDWVAEGTVSIRGKVSEPATPGLDAFLAMIRCFQVKGQTKPGIVELAVLDAKMHVCRGYALAVDDLNELIVRAATSLCRVRRIVENMVYFEQFDAWLSVDLKDLLDVGTTPLQRAVVLTWMTCVANKPAPLYLACLPKPLKTVKVVRPFVKALLEENLGDAETAYLAAKYLSTVVREDHGMRLIHAEKDAVLCHMKTACRELMANDGTTEVAARMLAATTNGVADAVFTRTV